LALSSLDSLFMSLSIEQINAMKPESQAVLLAPSSRLSELVVLNIAEMVSRPAEEDDEEDEEIIESVLSDAIRVSQNSVRMDTGESPMMEF